MAEKTAPKVLIVEDDPLFQRAWEQKLRSEGLEPVIAEDGSRGLELAESEAPRVIVMDLMMPNLSGFEALEYLKKEPATKDIPVFIVSSLENEADITRAKDLGAAQFFGKSAGMIDQVVAEIKGILGSSTSTT